MGRGRASKKKKKKLIIDDDEVPSSVYAVIANDDLLIEILLRLPTCSLLRFKSVSKCWLSLIMGPVSTTLRCSQNPKVEPLSGLFLQRYIHRDSHIIYDYVPFDIRFQVNRSPPVNTDFRFDFPDEGNAYILQSCNGLLLCYNPDTHYVYNQGDTHYVYNQGDTHYIYNPSTNQCRSFPPCSNSSEVQSYIGGMRLAYDPIKSPYYKLVSAWEKRDDDRGSNYTQIQTYSSETGTWSICPEKFPDSKFILFRRAIYWNDTLHWIHGRIHYKLDVENLVLTNIQTPDVLEPFSKLFESRGCLLLVGRCTNHTDDRTRHIAIYEMSKGYSVWSKKYLVNLDDDINMKLFPLRAEPQPAILMGCYKVLCMVLGEKEEDSFLVMETCGKVVQYEILLKTIRELYDWGTLHPEVKRRYRVCYQYYASFASV